MRLSEIEAAIEKLPPEELAYLAVSFAEYHHPRWDERIAVDLGAGRLDDVIREAGNRIRGEQRQEAVRHLALPGFCEGLRYPFCGGASSR